MDRVGADFDRSVAVGFHADRFQHTTFDAHVDRALSITRELGALDEICVRRHQLRARSVHLGCEKGNGGIKNYSPLVRRAAHYCQPVADGRFRQQIEERYAIKLGQMDRGRPRKEDG